MNTNPCSVCFQPLNASRNRTIMHPGCVAQFNRKPDGVSATPYPSFEPSRVTYEVPGPVGRPIDDLRNNARLNEKRQTPGSGMSPVRIGVLDIETTGLNAGFGVILGAVVKAYSPDETRIFRADEYAPWKRGERGNDKELLLDLLSFIEDIDIIIAHNGLKFDMPFIRTRALIHGLPPVNFQKIIDPVQLARQHFRFSGNSLDSISKCIGTQAQKTPLTPETWQRASLNGDKAAMDEIMEHCVYDVEVLAEICWKIRGYVRTIDKAGSFRG